MSQSNRTEPLMKMMRNDVFLLFVLLLISPNYARLGVSVCFTGTLFIYFPLEWSALGRSLTQESDQRGESDRAQGLGQRVMLF